MRNYEILYDLPEGEYDDAAVGGIRTRTIRAGDSLEVECYPITRISLEAERERERRRSSPAQQALNLRNARNRVRRLLEHNFTRADYVLHPTFDYGPLDRLARGEANRGDVLERMARAGLPMCEADARRMLRNYIKRVRRRMGARAGELKYLYVLESSWEPRDENPAPLPARYHYHMVIHAPGLSRETLEALWPHGYCNADRLTFRDDGLAGLAKYMTKQRGLCGDREAGRARRWAGSKNLADPEVRVSNRKVSRRRAALVARDVQQYGREIFERIYPGYRCVEDPTVRYSDFVAGAYIYARMRRERE